MASRSLFILGVCALQAGCSGEAQIVGVTTSTGGLGNGVGGSSVTLAGSSGVFGGTGSAGGVTSAPPATTSTRASGGLSGTGGSNAGGTRTSGGASASATGGAGTTAASGGASANATGGRSATGGASATAVTGGASATSATGGANSTGGQATTGGVSTSGSSIVSGGSTSSGGVASTGGTTASGGTSQGGSAACSDVTTAAECDNRTDCHSVYQDPHACDCATVGCCARFSYCAEGGKASCSPQAVACPMLQPYCESPAYVISYSGNCFEGCVKPADCDVVGVCGSNCFVDTVTTSPVCAASSQLFLRCEYPYPSELPDIMARNGCSDAGLGSIAFCCPASIQAQCQ